MSKLPLTVIVMTFNEQINLQESLNSVKNFADEIIVVDSFSTDDTLEIAKKYTNQIFQNKFINQAKQFIWALENTNVKNEWILRLDADERWTKEGFEELRDIIENDKADGIYVKMKIFFIWSDYLVLSECYLFPEIFKICLPALVLSTRSLRIMTCLVEISITNSFIYAGNDIAQNNGQGQDKHASL